MRTPVACLLVAAALAPLAPRAGRAQELPARPPLPAVTVQGTGEVRADPDEATVRLGVIGQAPTARAAQEKVNQAANAVLAALRGLGIEPTDLQTSDLSLSPLYAQVRPDATSQYQEPRITGYSATNTVSVRLSKLDLVGRAIDAGLAAGANQVEGVSFGLKNDLPARTRALEAAVAEAHAKAEAIARGLGVKLGEVLEVAEGSVSTFAPQPFPKALAMADRAGATPVAAGQLTISATVTVRYRIAP